MRREVASRLFAKIERGDKTHWRGHALEVREVKGRRGASGKNYLVKVSSLPPYLQERLKALQTPVEAPSKMVLPDSRSAREHVWWKTLLEPALQHPKGSKERRTALEEIAARQHFDWRGKSITLSVRALQRRAAKHEDGVKLGRHGRSDKGRRRVYVSRSWDKAVPVDGATKAKIAEDLKQEIRGLFKGGAKWGIASMLARRFLVTATSSYGYRPADPAELERICAIPKLMLSAELHYRKVHQFKRDRKAYEDSRPRISRTIDGLRPMEIVVADVHPVDILLTRRDGTTATARLLGFLDWATWRVWCELVFIEGRGGVRNVDLIEAFGAMVEDPAFGLPENLYIDNGKEYLFASFLDDAMRLNVPCFSSPERSRSTIIKAKPYNAAAKVIESFFKNFEARFLSTLPGWIGGDRMNKKQETVGRTAAPLGTFEDFVPAFYGLLRAYEHTAQGKDSKLKGQSPAMLFKAHVDAGWAATVMSRDEMRAACAHTETRTVSQGRISVGNVMWSCPALWDYPHDRVQVRVPAYHEPAELLLLDLNGERLGIATPDRAFHPLDQRGAREADGRSKARRSMVRKLDKSAPTIDIAERLTTFGQEREAVTPNAPDGTVTFDRATRPARVLVPGPKSATACEEEQREADEVFDIQQALANRRSAG
ncbi:Mu transposase C-terminal domain-containing protein [Chelativorans xinjiangense]|uniref:Mu transposase C-terminal domain-containing protein n=1 Tax=Chelativorans xinjiangense TaxID=2681485 RepID=UPI00135C98B5|nr:Mu transposase C-terminal domain-containing protein [Chelativorans xinjiangense]